MEIFNNAEFGSVRIIEENGSFLFCASDVAKALGYSNVHSALQRHCKGVVKRDTVTSTRGIQALTYIPEGDVYRLIVHSKLPSAERFERWVFDEVLPSLRRNGIYITDPLVRQFARDPDFAHAVVDALYEQTERVNRLLPKADYFDAFVDPGDAVPIRIAAKQLGVSEHWLVRLLVGCRMLYRCNGRLVPYADRRFRGMFVVKERRTMVTPLGKQVLHEFIGMLTSDEKAAV
ncbi:MAG TPA: phage antirepressor KilAC domain-containing protein [Candidatus Scatomorpha gallistercoris]|nr:phage antirepressor KilAC domain-containing protein [Candidatus Scatomorpha gallistercoris]